MEEERQLSSYFKEMVLHIRIALAIAVIRTTPPGITAREHARNIQALYKLKSLSREQKGPLNKHEQEVLYLQQKELLSKLWMVTQKGILQQQKTTSDLMNTTDQDPAAIRRYTTEYEETSEEFGTDETLSDNIEPNLQFIHAIAHLTSIINSFSHIPLDEYHTILSSADCHSDSNLHAETDINGDGGIYSCLSAKHSINLKRDRLCISSDMVQYIMHSSNGRKILMHSVQCVLHYLRQSISSENETQLEKIVVNWKGSLLEHAVKVVLNLVDCAAGEDEEQNQYCQICLDFIQNIVDEILENNTFHKHHIWEQMSTLVLEIGNNKHICCRMINYLVEKVKCMGENLKSKDNISKEYLRSLDIEKSFYLFYLLEHFINIWKSFHTSYRSMKNVTKTPPKSSNSCTNVTDLWRRKWSDSVLIKQEKTNSNERKEIISKWKDVLQDCLMSCKEQYPLIMTCLWECCLLLEPIDD